MKRVRLLVAPVVFAARRIRARPLSFVAVAVALGAAAGLIGWTSVSAARAQNKSVRLRLADLSPRDRALTVTYFTLPDEADARAPLVASTLDEFADVTAPLRRVRISHSVVPGNPLGTRLVGVSDMRLVAGAHPNGCCEAVALTPTAATRVLGLRIVGHAKLRPGVLPDPTELGAHAYLVRSLDGKLASLVRAHGSTVVMSAALVPDRVRGDALDDLRRRLHDAFTRLERGDPLVRTRGPLAALDELAKRGRIARQRLLLVSGEAAALVLAFAAFIAASRRREAETVDEQLTTLGASRAQAWTARATELLAPGIVGAAAAAMGTWVAARVTDVHVPAWTFAAIVIVGVVGAAVLTIAVHERRVRFGTGALELAALTALALIVWQTTTTGALDPDAVARSGAAPMIILVPALAFFAAAVILLRVLPVALRAGERAGRRTPLVRLAFVTAARNPTHAAAATTFLAVALGASLFSLSYRATIDRQARDAARFAVGVPWRAGPAAEGARVVRLDGDVDTVNASGSRIQVRVLALPANAIPQLEGWRKDFAPLSRRSIAERLRPNAVQLTGPCVARDATALRVWARSQTDYPRTIIAHFLLPNDLFAEVALGTVWRKWQLLRTTLPPRVRGAQLIAVQYAPTTTPIDFKYDPEGLIDLGPFEQRHNGRWSKLPSLAKWTATTLPTGASGLLYGWHFRNAPVANGTRFDVNGTLQPIVHPRGGLPDPLAGFQTGALPALASEPIASQAVDRLITLDVAGKQVPLNVVARAKLFPTIAHNPNRFVVIDYDTVFAALNADQPGVLTPTEAWSFTPTRPPPGALTIAHAESRLRNDPLAAGTRGVLVLTGVLSAALALIGLVLSARSTLVAERLALAEYEALGVAPRLLRRSTQLRLLVLSAVGIAAGLGGAVLATRLVGALVAITGTARRPLPPIASVIAWSAGAVVLAILLVAAVGTTAVVAGRALREPVAKRLRA